MENNVSIRGTYLGLSVFNVFYNFCFMFNKLFPYIFSDFVKKNKIYSLEN